MRGNHEERPENLGYNKIWDENVKGLIYQDPNFENIHYFVDGGIYDINGYSVLVIGGAYSVDKYWRLANSSNRSDSWSGWFASEQLTADEMMAISENTKNGNFDFVLSHACPVDWEPTDLFLSMISQDQVDKSMENWMQDLKDNFNWNVWLFGHYHADRIIKAKVEMLYESIQDLNDIFHYWKQLEE